MKTYHGKRSGGDTTPGPVTVSAHYRKPRPLVLRHDLTKHPGCGFNWGYFGSGPNQLATALLSDALGHDDLAVALHQQFKDDVISQLSDEWWLTDLDVIDWIRRRMRQAAPPNATPIHE
jgi:hypothetical protein